MVLDLFFHHKRLEYQTKHVEQPFQIFDNRQSRAVIIGRNGTNNMSSVVTLVFFFTILKQEGRTQAEHSRFGEVKQQKSEFLEDRDGQNLWSRVQDKK